jgi:LDH2 family malate/lactate/ureidoglycolate dehydrogenase
MHDAILIPADTLARRVSQALADAGASAESVEAATRAMMHASRLGVDSHGVRLTEHYTRALRGGRVNARPAPSVRRTGPATAILDGDDGLGHLTGFRAMELAVEIAGESGVGAVGAVRSSHYGAAGAYAFAAAEAGMIGFATTNADSMVAPFEGARAFHGTNPLAFAAPVPDSRPWLLDMATSSIPFNRVLLFRSLAKMLPDGVAADAQGAVTRDAEAAEMLMPLGGTGFGFKGAALAGLATLFSAILTGTPLDHDMIKMVGTTDLQTPRNMGHFFLAIDPERFVDRGTFDKGILSYLQALRSVPPAAGGHPVMAPGDREWRVEEERLRDGIPIDPDTARFLGLSAPDGNAGSGPGAP